MSRIELSREERWEWLRKTCWGKSIIPWERMALPSHEWMDNVQTLDRVDDKTFLTTKGQVIVVPRYWDELTEEMTTWINQFTDYKNQNKDVL
jgi:hypothetical protein